MQSWRRKGLLLKGLFIFELWAPRTTLFHKEILQNKAKKLSPSKVPFPSAKFPVYFSMLQIVGNTKCNFLRNYPVKKPNCLSATFPKSTKNTFSNVSISTSATDKSWEFLSRFDSVWIWIALGSITTHTQLPKTGTSRFLFQTWRRDINWNRCFLQLVSFEDLWPQSKIIWFLCWVCVPTVKVMVRLVCKSVEL